MLVPELAPGDIVIMDTLGSHKVHFPAAHWAKLHSTNLIERLNGEIERHTDVVGISAISTVSDTAAVRLSAVPA